MTMPITPQVALARVIEHREIFHDEIVDLFRQIMRGEVSPVITAALLIGLRVKKETIGEIAGAAQVMREFCAKVAIAPDPHFVDIVGTGGDRSHSINVSTMAAIVTASAGVPVCKHGARAASSKCGTADVLEALGVVVSLPPEGVKRCVDEAGIAASNAPTHRPPPPPPRAPK